MLKTMKLKYKLIAVILAATCIALFSYLVFVTVNYVRHLRKSMAENTITIAHTTGNNLIAELAFHDPDSASNTLAKLKSIPYIEHAVIFDSSGRRLAEYHAADAAPLNDLKRKYGSGFDSGYFTLYEKIVYDYRYYGDIFLKASTGNLDEKIWDFIKDIATFTLFLLAAVLGMAWHLQRYISKPILKLANSFKEIAQKKDYSLKLEKMTGDEIGTLYDGFNEMMEQISQHQQELKNHKENLESLVTERTRELKDKNIHLETTKEEAENANRLKSEFLANMSHEIRTPLNAIMGFTEIMTKDEKDMEKRYYLSTIKKSGESLLKLINNILDFSKIEANRLELNEETFSPGKLVRHLENVFAAKAQERGLFFKITGLARLPDFVTGDGYRLSQVLMNILANAFKFTSKGEVTVACKYDYLTHVLEISVTDTGIGISQEQQTVIFNPFRQADGSTSRKYGGTGLGLSISQRLVKLMDGVLSLESQVGGGSVFIVKVPFAEAPEPAKNGEKRKNGTVRYESRNYETIDSELTGHNSFQERDKAEYDPGLKGRAANKLSILVAEDDRINQKLIKAYFKRMGRDCDIAGNGKIALEMMGEKPYEVLFLDIQMPVMDGLQTIAQIRSIDQFKDIHVVALTANAVKGDREKYIGAGCDDYLSKPVTFETLRDRIVQIEKLIKKKNNVK